MKKNYLIFAMIVLVATVFYACSDDEVGKGGVDIPHSPSDPIVLTDIGPKEGGLGTRVVITGKNFGNDKEKVKLFFNDKESLVLDVNNQNIYAMTPKQPGDSSVIKVVIDKGEGILKEHKFAYHIKAVVTTIAGIYNQASTSEPIGATPLETKFGRPVGIDVDDEGNVIVLDDTRDEIFLISTTENKIRSIGSGFTYTWSGTFSHDYKRYYAVEGSSGTRPLLILGFNKEANWAMEKFYDSDNHLGDRSVYGLSADHDRSLYVLSSGGERLLKVDQFTKRVELIGKDLDLPGWVQMTYNTYDHYLYICTEGNPKVVFRIDPKDASSNNLLGEDDVEVYAGSTMETGYRDGYRTDALFQGVEGMTSDNEGNIYLAEYGNYIVRKIDKDGIVTTVAGVPGKSGYKDGKPNEALFGSALYDVAVDPSGIIYVAETGNKLIRSIAIQ